MTGANCHAGTAEELVERIFGAVLGFNDVHLIYIGDRLGLYRALDERSAATPAELAAVAGTDARYTREWLEHQAVGGIVLVDDSAAPAEDRRYSLPPGHAEVLLDRDSPNYMAAFARMMIGMAKPLESVLDAFRSGSGVPYSAYPPDFCEGQGDMNRVQFVNSLAAEWIPELPDVHARLQAEPAARVADVACGTGWSSIALAIGYPLCRVDGSDLDEASITLARSNVADAGLAGRVRMDCRDAAALAATGPYDLITLFEAVHDMSRPVEVLSALREALADSGVLLVADERVAETFTAPGDDVERVMYGWSVLHCLPVGMADQPSAATGTAMRPDTLAAYAREAGFASICEVPIENDFWRFYRLERRGGDL